MHLQHFSYLGWLMMGVSVGFGPCFSHHFLVLLPYIGAVSRDARGGFLEVLYFSAARILTYGVMGAGAALTGMILHLAADAHLPALAGRTAFGALLMALAVVALFAGDSFACSQLHRRLVRRPGRAMALAGFLIALTPCPFFLGLLGAATASGSPVYGTLAAVSFAAGTAISPLLVAGPLLGLVKERLPTGAMAQCSRIAGGLLLFGYGVHLVVSAWI